MTIVLKHMARVILPEDKRHEVLSLYWHESRSGDIIRNYKYADGIAYLPLNPRKLEQVAELLGERIDDQRANAQAGEHFDLNPEFAFRTHQYAPANQLLAEAHGNFYAVIQAGCGLGKTVVMTWVAGNIQSKILVIVDMGSLLSQWEDAFRMVWNRKVQILDRDDETFGDVCITTFQMLHANPELLRRISSAFGCLLLDEFHTTQSDTRREILFRLNNQYRIGCTATPWKKGYSDDVLTDLVADVSVVMVDNHALKPDVIFVATGVSFYSNNADDWGKTQSFLAQNEKRNRQIMSTVMERIADGRKILVVCITVEQCEIIEAQIKGYPACRTVVYTGSTTLKQDRQLKEDLASGKINCIFTVKKADKGLDLPSLDCLVLARPHNNRAFLEQISGRIVRVLEGKPHPEIYDLKDTGQLAETFAKNRQRWYKNLGYRIVAS